MNIILVVADSLRQDHLGCYGNSWIKTPALDSFASESMRFTSLFPESLPTIPVRRALHTGVRTYPFRNHRQLPWDIVKLPGWGPIPDEQITVAEQFHGSGYHTALITDTLPIFQPGFNFHRGFDQFIWIRGQQQDRWASLGKIRDMDISHHFVNPEHQKILEPVVRQYLANVSDRKSEEDWFAPMVFRRAIRWLEEQGDSAPFFLMIDAFDPHEPWDPPDHYTDMYDPDRSGKEIIHCLYGDSSYLSSSDLKQVRARYAGEVSMVDRWFGKLMERIVDLGRDRDTLVIFMSDHGHMLGEHGIMGKVPSALYPELMDVPVLIRDPDGQGAGEVRDDLGYLTDIIASIFNRAGIEPVQPLDGRSIWSGGLDRNYVTSAFKDYCWARDESWVFWSHFSGKDPYLFDTKGDPEFRENVASKHPDQVSRLFQYCLDDAGDDGLPVYEDMRTTFADGSQETPK